MQLIERWKEERLEILTELGRLLQTLITLLVKNFILCDPIWHVSSRSGEAGCELLYPRLLRLYLEVVESLHLGAHALQLVIIDLLDLSQRLSHLVLPELAVLGRRVAVCQSRQLLHLLNTPSSSCKNLTFQQRNRTVTRLYGRQLRQVGEGLNPHLPPKPPVGLHILGVPFPEYSVIG